MCLQWDFNEEIRWGNKVLNSSVGRALNLERWEVVVLIPHSRCFFIAINIFDADGIEPGVLEHCRYLTPLSHSCLYFLCLSFVYCIIIFSIHWFSKQVCTWQRWQQQREGRQCYVLSPYAPPWKGKGKKDS